MSFWPLHAVSSPPRCSRHCQVGWCKTLKVREGNLNTEQNSYGLLIVLFILFHLCMQIPKDHLHSASPKAPGFRFSCIFTCHIGHMSGCRDVVLLGQLGHGGHAGWNSWNPPPSPSNLLASPPATPATPATAGDPLPKTESSGLRSSRSGRSGEKPRPYVVRFKSEQI